MQLNNEFNRNLSNGRVVKLPVPEETLDDGSLESLVGNFSQVLIYKLLADALFQNTEAYRRLCYLTSG